MSSQIYDRGYKNLGEGGYYYDGNWYSTEQAFNEAGYYEAKDAIVYLGTSSTKVKLQSIYYLLGDEYYTFNELHKLGYSLTRSIVKYFVNTLDNTYYSGYYNNSDGYFVNDGLGLWYTTIQELNAAGYDVGDSYEYI